MATLKSINKKVEKRQDGTLEEVDRFIKNLKKFLDKGLEEIVGELEDGNIDPALYLGGLLEQLKKRGLRKQMGELQAIYGKELKRVQGSFTQDGYNKSLAYIGKETLTQLITFKVEDIENKSLDVIGSLRPIMLEQVITGQKIDIEPLKDKISGRLFGNIKTELNTAMLNFSRTISASKYIEEGTTKFLYAGPLDDITRPFCEEVLTERDPAIYTLDEILSMDNGQIGDVMTSCGGYNCRHQWAPVSDSLEKQLNGEEEDLDAQLAELELDE